MIFAKKSLGQNFLRSEKALTQIVDAADIRVGDTIIEIGPGEGALTEKILDRIAALGVTLSNASSTGDSVNIKRVTKTANPTKLIAIEKDDRLIPMLEEKYKAELDSKRFSILHKDVLEILTSEHFNELNIKTGVQKVQNIKYKIIGNIPYYITGILMRQIFELEHLPERVVLTVQKEVADRMVALDGKESLLSLSIKIFGTPKRVAVVPRGAFVPAPNVDSAIVLIENIERKLSRTDENFFFEFIHAAFAHKRKRLVKNVDGVGGKSALEWEQVLEKTGFGPNTRAEELSIENYLNILHI